MKQPKMLGVSYELFAPLDKPIKHGDACVTYCRRARVADEFGANLVGCDHRGSLSEYYSQDAAVRWKSEAPEVLARIAAEEAKEGKR